jgi:hypothetical protein
MYKSRRKSRRLRKRRTRRKRGGNYVTYRTTGAPDPAVGSQLVSTYQTEQMNKIINS